MDVEILPNKLRIFIANRGITGSLSSGKEGQPTFHLEASLAFSLVLHCNSM